MPEFQELSLTQLDELREIIERWCGIIIDEKGAVMLEFRMYPLLEKFECGDFGEFLELVRGGRMEVRDHVIDAVTTNETLWFRDGVLYESLLEKILPTAFETARAAGRTGLKIWSGAASTGQEAYSLSMLVHELAREGKISAAELDRTRIVGTDISPAALLIANKGIYDAISMARGMWPEFESRYFCPTGKSSAVLPEVQRIVSFQRRNLMDSFFGLGPFDLVLLRNVLIYFSTEMKSGILARVQQTMNPKGILIVGACEDASRYSRDYESQRVGKTLYFQTKKAS